MEYITIFLHMPKTGGSTLNGIVRRMYDSDRLYATPDVILDRYGSSWKQVPDKERWKFARDSFAALPDSKIQNLDAVLGHLWFGWHELTERPCRYVTFLRHPAHRFISYYNYIRDHRGHPVSEKIQTENLDLQGFMDDQELSELPENQQTKFLTGDFNPDLKTLEQATKNIEDHFLLVGFTEHFDADLLRPSQLLDWPQPYYSRRNTSRAHVSLSDLDVGLVHEIIRQNQLDMALYESVKARRDARSTTRTGTFQILNWLRDLLVARRFR